MENQGEHCTKFNFSFSHIGAVYNIKDDVTSLIDWHSVLAI